MGDREEARGNSGQRQRCTAQVEESVDKTTSYTNLAVMEERQTQSHYCKKIKTKKQLTV